MANPNWGLLTKSQVDNEKVEEAIARLILVHEEDEDSHLGVGESLQSHKASEIIDHIAESIVNDKIQPLARAYTAIVSDIAGDFVDIQDAIDYVVGLGGGSILITAGTYEISASLVVTGNNVEIFGEGPLTILHAANGLNNSILKVMGPYTSYSRNIVADLKISGNQANQTSGYGVTCGAADSVLRNLEITDCKEGGVYLGGVRNTVFGCNIHNNSGQGIYASNSVYAMVTQNYVKTHSSCGIYFNSGNHNSIFNNKIDGAISGVRLSNGETKSLITGNSIVNCTGQGILMQDNVSSSAVDGNFIESCLVGVQMTAFAGGYCLFNIVSNNVIRLSNNYAIELWNNTDVVGRVSQNTVIGNTIESTSRDAIRLLGVRFNTVVGNTIDKSSFGATNTYCDIFISDNGRGTPTHSDYNSVDSNNINCSDTPKSKYCIRENSASENYNLVVGNIAQNAVTANISLQGANSVAANNI